MSLPQPEQGNSFATRRKPFLFPYDVEQDSEQNTCSLCRDTMTLGQFRQTLAELVAALSDMLDSIMRSHVPNENRTTGV